MELSNKSLALLLVAALVVSLGGTLISLNKLQSGLTGLAMSGYVNLSINSSAGCNIDTNVSFGNGPRPAGPVNLSSNRDNSLTDGFNNCTDGASTNNCKGMQINNTGTVNINVTMTSTANGTDLLNIGPGNESKFQFIMRNGTYAGSYLGCYNSNYATAWVPVSKNYTTVCLNQTWQSINNIITLEYNVTIDQDTPPGQKSATITLSCIAYP
jgi:hypothetical protein